MTFGHRLRTGLEHLRRSDGDEWRITAAAILAGLVDEVAALQAQRGRWRQWRAWAAGVVVGGPPVVLGWVSIIERMAG